MVQRSGPETLGRVLQAPMGINHPEVALSNMSKLQNASGRMNVLTIADVVSLRDNRVTLSVRSLSA